MDLKLKSAGEIINHLITWGEISRFELSGIAGAQDWVAIFKNAGVLNIVATDIWSLSPELWSLLREDAEKALRNALFQVPEYRDYLISILAEGAASAAKQGLLDEVEKWSGNELLPFLSSINRMLNQIEADGKRIIDQKKAALPVRFTLYAPAAQPPSESL